LRTLNRWLFLLILAVPAALIAESLHAPSLVPFILAALGLIPLAGIIGQATEVLAERLGPNTGGLLNATFGNAAEIIIGIAALAAGLPDVVEASLAGSIIGNILLVLGSAMLLGGWRHRRQVFDERTARQYAVMLALVVIGLSIPSLLATVGESRRTGEAVLRGTSLHQLSVGVAVILLLCYAAYILFSIFGLRADPVATLPRTDASHGEKAEISDKAIQTVPSGKAVSRSSVEADVEEKSVSGQVGNVGRFAALENLWKHTVWLPLVVLAVATAVTAVASETLVGTIDPLTKQIGLNPLFVGLIVLPIVGNAAEHFSAITAAIDNKMEISLSITAGSSIQVALFAAPVLVIIGALIGAPLDLTFSLLEVVLFGFVAGLYALICLDGESTWLEGLLLCAFYLILALGSFFAPA
jgi:Ca2+:H+ antiporter